MNKTALLAIAVLAVGCGEPDCDKAQFYPINPSLKCVQRAPVASGCVAEVSPTINQCSVGANGAFYLSHDGQIFPGGRSCSDAEVTTIGFNALSACP